MYETKLRNDNVAYYNASNSKGKILTKAHLSVLEGKRGENSQIPRV